MSTDNKYHPFEELTQMQLQYGYKQGELNPVALLGLIGEAGEVLNEITFIEESGCFIETQKVLTVLSAGILDDIKKKVRTNLTTAPSVIICSDDIDGGKKFDLELADLLYYANLVALGRGRDLAYYAQLSVEKVKAKGLKSPVPSEPIPHLDMDKGAVKTIAEKFWFIGSGGGNDNSQHDPGDENVIKENPAK